MNIILSIELVPSTAWYTNVRSNVSPQQWDIIRRKSYSHANNKCEICGDNGKNQGVKHFVECHEIWEYNDETHKQILTGLISLCPYCHKTKHAGLAHIKGEQHIVIKQLMKVNGMSRKQALDYIDSSFNIWENRSKFQWEIDISYLETYLNQQ